jgi:hypothetical protein
MSFLVGTTGFEPATPASRMHITTQSQSRLAEILLKN